MLPAHPRAALGGKGAGGVVGAGGLAGGEQGDVAHLPVEPGAAEGAVDAAAIRRGGEEVLADQRDVDLAAGAALLRQRAAGDAHHDAMAACDREAVGEGQFSALFQAWKSRPATTRLATPAPVSA